MTSQTQETIKTFLFKGEDDHENLEIRTIEVNKSNNKSKSIHQLKQYF